MQQKKYKLKKKSYVGFFKPVFQEFSTAGTHQEAVGGALALPFMATLDILVLPYRLCHNGIATIINNSPKKIMKR